MKTTTEQALKRKWTGLIDKDGKMHSANGLNPAEYISMASSHPFSSQFCCLNSIITVLSEILRLHGKHQILIRWLNQKPAPVDLDSTQNKC